MNTLVIDRSSAQPCFAVFHDQALLCSHTWTGEPTRAPAWLLEMQHVMASNNISLDSIQRFICGLGPGSFSGIRACLAAINGLALPAKLPVYGLASAAAIVLDVPDESVTVIGDARRSRLWCVTYRKLASGGLLLADGKPPTHSEHDFRLIEAKDLVAAIPEGSRIVSTDWARLEALLTSQFDATRLLQAPAYPSPLHLGTLALADASTLKREPSPIYLHPAV